MEIHTKDGIVLRNIPDGTSDEAIKARIYQIRGETPEASKEKHDPYTFENIAGSAVEPILTLGTGAAGAVAGGLAGLSEVAANLFRDEGEKADTTKTIRDVQEAMTYQPMTRGGQIATEAIAYPFQKFAEATEYGGGRIAKKIGEDISPEVGAAIGAGVKTAADIAPMLLGAKAMKGKPTFPKIEEAIKYPIKKPIELAGKVGRAAKEAISHRVTPGGRERALGAAITEMVGPRRAKVIQALEQAKKGETAGQAATGAGSYELSALQRMAESRDPSGYGEIAAAQQAARAGRVGKIAKTPEKLISAIRQRSVRTDPLYKAAREGRADIKPVVSSVDKLIKENPGNAVLLTELKKIKGGLIDKTGKVRTNTQEILSSVDALKGAIANKDNAFIKSKLTKVKNDLIDAIPKYKDAQRVFREESRLINEMEIGRELSKSLEPLLGSRERARVFAGAVEHAPRTIKRATGDPRFQTLEDALAKKSMQAVSKTRAELNRDALMAEQATKGSRAMNEAMGTMYDIPKVGILERSIVIMNSIIKRIEGKNTKVTLDMIAEKMKDPAEMARIMKQATPAERAALSETFASMGRGAVAGSVAAGANQ